MTSVKKTKNLKCFVVDDEQFSVDAISGYINKTDALELIDGFTDPLIALQEIVKGIKPDLVFLDVDMFKMSGIKFANNIPQDIQIIFITGLSKKDLLGEEVHFYDCLSKPISFQKFQSCISDLIMENTLSKIDDKNN